MKPLLLLSVVSVFLLSACAVPLTSAEMLPDNRVYDHIAKNKYDAALAIGNVTVAAGVGGMTPVTPENFQDALLTSLRIAGMYDRDGHAKYILDAHVSEIDQPMFGFTFTVDGTVHYTIRNAKTGADVFDENMTLPCSKTISDAFVAEARLRMATGCAMGENISHFLRTISN